MSENGKRFLAIHLWFIVLGVPVAIYFNIWSGQFWKQHPECKDLQLKLQGEVKAYNSECERDRHSSDSMPRIDWMNNYCTDNGIGGFAS